MALLLYLWIILPFYKNEPELKQSPEMKPTFESVYSPEESSFIVKKFIVNKFPAPYHFHPEMELTYILQGKGKRYIGATMTDYFPGDLVLLGPNLPHCWKTEVGSKEHSIAYVIHFTENSFGKDFFLCPELAQVSSLLKSSQYGLQFTGENQEIRKGIISSFTEKDPFTKLIMFLRLLQQLSQTSFIYLDKQHADILFSDNEQERINAVITYLIENFQNNVSLSKAASIANMTTHSFCKYFKKMTRKTFLEALNEYRIGFATKQLINTDKPVADIAYESGFKDASNFHKTFKRKLNLSPLVYRNTFMKTIKE